MFYILDTLLKQIHLVVLSKTSDDTTCTASLSISRPTHESAPHLFLGGGARGRRGLAGDRGLTGYPFIDSRHLSGSARGWILFFRHWLLLGFHCS